MFYTCSWTNTGFLPTLTGTTVLSIQIGKVKDWPETTLILLSSSYSILPWFASCDSKHAHNYELFVYIIMYILTVHSRSIIIYICRCFGWKGMDKSRFMRSWDFCNSEQTYNYILTTPLNTRAISVQEVYTNVHVYIDERTNSQVSPSRRVRLAPDRGWCNVRCHPQPPQPPDGETKNI